MLIDNKYSIGQVVFLKTDPDQLPRIVTQIKITSKDILYQLSICASVSDHYDYEISENKNVLVDL